MTPPQPGPLTARSPNPSHPARQAPPHWEIRTDHSGSLTAVLTGFAITVTAPDEATLRKRISDTIMRGML
jgi:hypothetical protein